MMSIANIGMAEVEDFIADAKWQFAKTMPQIPHEYTVRDWNDSGKFEAFLHYILHYGELRKVKNWKRIYLDVGDYYYWWMGAPISKAVVINRAMREEMWDASSRI